jgi:hypothetical protein
MQFLMPMTMRKRQLIELLQFVIQGIQDDDSVEGNLEYTGIGDLNYGEFKVIGGIRFGNRDGQGFIRIIGEQGRTAIDAKLPAPHADLPKLKAEDLPAPIRTALKAVVNYNWKDEQEDYIHGCGDGPNDNQRQGHIFESLVVLNNLADGIEENPRDYLPKEEETIDA